METTNQNNLDEIISQDTEKINNDEQTKSEIVYIEVDKLHPHSHLFTNLKLIEFPGRRFMIEAVIPFKKDELKKHIEGKKMNITTRNFPLTVEEIRKKYKIAEGGNVYTFFTTNINDEKIVLICNKI